MSSRNVNIDILSIHHIDFDCCIKIHHNPLKFIYNACHTTAEYFFGFFSTLTKDIRADLLTFM